MSFPINKDACVHPLTDGKKINVVRLSEERAVTWTATTPLNSFFLSLEHE